MLEQMLEWHDVVGNIGVLLIVGSYCLMQLGRLSGTSNLYAGLNALGAAAVLVSLVYEFNFPAFVIECFWLAASLFGMAYRIHIRRLAGIQEQEPTQKDE